MGEYRHMKSYLDCLPCFCNQTLEAVKFVSQNEALQEQVLRSVLKAASEMDLQTPPPVMGRQIHHLIQEITGNSDPYKEAKQLFNKAALAMYPELKKRSQARGILWKPLYG